MNKINKLTIGLGFIGFGATTAVTSYVITDSVKSNEHKEKIVDGKDYIIITINDNEKMKLNKGDVKSFKIDERYTTSIHYYERADSLYNVHDENIATKAIWINDEMYHTTITLPQTKGYQINLEKVGWVNKNVISQIDFDKLKSFLRGL